MKCLERWLPLSLNIFLLLFSVANAAVVRLEDYASVKGNEVYLRDIAKIEGSNVEISVLSGIRIVSSPSLCKKRTLNRDYVVQRIVQFLRENGVKFNRIKVEGAELITVERLCSLITKEQIVKEVKEFFKEKYPNYAVLSVSAPSKLYVSGKPDRTTVTVQSLGERYGRILYTVYEGRKPVKKLWLSVRISRKVPVAVAKQDIPAGKLITQKDISVIKVPFEKARKSLPPKEVIGKVAKETIRKDSLIKERMVLPNYLVKKGKPVKILYRNKGIYIELMGIAMENGVLGNIIRVKNVSTGKVLLCKVTGRNTVTFVSGH